MFKEFVAHPHKKKKKKKFNEANNSNIFRQALTGLEATKYFAEVENFF
jgi:hypothetical protein